MPWGQVFLPEILLSLLLRNRGSTLQLLPAGLTCCCCCCYCRGNDSFFFVIMYNFALWEFLPQRGSEEPLSFQRFVVIGVDNCIL